MLDRRIVHIPDIETDPTLSAWSLAQARASGIASFLAAPMLREDRPIGVVT